MKEFFRLLKLMIPQWPWLLLGVCCSAATLLANAALLSLAAWFLACMALAGISGVPFNYHLPSAGIRALAIVRTLGRYAERLFSHEATFRLLTTLRVWFFSRLEPLAPAGLKGMHSGDVFSRIKSDIDNLDEFYLRFILPMISAFFVLAAVFVCGCKGPYAPLAHKPGKEAAQHSQRIVIVDGNVRNALLFVNATSRLFPSLDKLFAQELGHIVDWFPQIHHVLSKLRHYRCQIASSIQHSSLFECLC